MAGVTKGTLLPKQEVNIKEGVYLAKCLSIDLQTCRKFCMDFLYNYVTINLALLTLKFKVQQAISSKKNCNLPFTTQKGTFWILHINMLVPWDSSYEIKVHWSGEASYTLYKALQLWFYKLKHSIALYKLAVIKCYIEPLKFSRAYWL